MANDHEQLIQGYLRTCTQCNRDFVISRTTSPKAWGYRFGERMFCGYKCMREFEKSASNNYRGTKVVCR